jgi:UDP-hydrolysing UDP-N-acetyl-D-glucosamine 2-epimerase
MHLAAEFGFTVNEIRNEGVRISKEFDFLLNGDEPFTLAKSMGIAVYELAHIFNHYAFDAICLLGDRFELLAVVNNALLFHKPIIHIHGGETTEGAIDNQVRNMISKAAHLHFVSCEEYAENVRRLGENPAYIFNTGALAIDNIKRLVPIPRDVLFEELDLLPDRPLVLATYHPVTLESRVPPVEQVRNLFNALASFDFQVVITAPNTDEGRQAIMDEILKQVNENPLYHYVESLGMRRYFSLLPHCEFVIGNSSSGLIEVPYFRIPTVNIGDRQKGRLRHESVIDVDYSVKSIKKGIEKAISSTFRKKLKTMTYKFGQGDAAEKMVSILKQVKFDQEFLRKS